MGALRAFIEARTAEDEAMARAAGEGETWIVRHTWDWNARQEYALTKDCASGVCEHCVIEGQDVRQVNGMVIYDEGGHDRADAEHIARQDPARTLREVAAKRALADLILRYEAQVDYEWGCCHSVEAIGAGECLATPPDEIAGLRLLASVWADHPDYRPDWSPGMVGAVERKDGIR